MAPELIPSILLQDEASVRERMASLNGLIDWAQVDILDNTLYTNTTWADPAIIKTWNTPYKLELHLMVTDPKLHIEAWKEVPAFQRAVWHIETDIDHHALIQYTRSLGKEVGLSIAPGTRIEALTPYLNLIDRVLVLGVNPGWSGQAMIPSTLETVRALTSTTPHPVIAFDGGINDDTIDALLEAGTEAICPNSWIFKYPPIKERLEMIHGKLNK